MKGVYGGVGDWLTGNERLRGKEKSFLLFCVFSGSFGVT